MLYGLRCLRRAPIGSHVIQSVWNNVISPLYQRDVGWIPTLALDDAFRVSYEHGLL